jgi:hypothetical protein
VAATTQIALPASAADPLALWHLLSLDAPTVAALWTWFIARSCRIALPPAVPVAMALAVWILYAADRLLDARHPGSDLEARHLFHHHHRRAFLAAIALATIAMVWLQPSLNPAALRPYLVEGTLLAAWFVILHATRIAHLLPKEIAVGIFFAAACCIPSIAREPALRLALLPPAILFATLCSLNCLFIYAWEHSGPAGAQAAHATTRFALARLPAIAATFAIVSTVVAFLASTPIPAACALAAVLLLVLHRIRGRFSRTHLRAAADMVLLTPLLLLPILR